jgi:hypothetical protein
MTRVSTNLGVSLKISNNRGTGLKISTNQQAVPKVSTNQELDLKISTNQETVLRTKQGAKLFTVFSLVLTVRYSSLDLKGNAQVVLEK